MCTGHAIFANKQDLVVIPPVLGLDIRLPRRKARPSSGELDLLRLRQEYFTR